MIKKESKIRYFGVKMSVLTRTLLITRREGGGLLLISYAILTFTFTFTGVKVTLVKPCCRWCRDEQLVGASV